MTATCGRVRRRAGHLLVRRERGPVVVERLAPGDFALLRALTDGGDLAAALDAAVAAEPAFDLARAAHGHRQPHVAELRSE